MYSVDGKDRVVELRDVPQSSVGAPLPHVLASEGELALTYNVEDVPPDWDGTTVRVVDPESSAEPAAIVRFTGVRASMFGPPNDEAFSGHPLAARGLRPYGEFEVLGSSWVRQLERMNAVHPHHDPMRFSRYRHFVLAFHDSTFECVATGYSCEITDGPLNAVVRRIAETLR